MHINLYNVWRYEGIYRAVVMKITTAMFQVYLNLISFESF